MQTLISKIKAKLQNSSDIITHEFVSFNEIKTTLVYIDEICKSETINLEVIAPLMRARIETKSTSSTDYAIKHAIAISETIKTSKVQEIVDNILKGFCAVIFENENEVVLVNAQNFTSRAITEPPTSAVLKGPREGFTESLTTNLMLLRKRLINSNFTIEEEFVGKYSQTRVCVCYVKGIADLEIVNQIKEKIKKISIDGIIDSFYIQNFLEKKGYSLFKQIGSTEKPDIAVAKMLEGRIVVVVNGSPIVLTMPYILFEDIQNSNDYYFSRRMRVRFLRYLRLIGVIIAVFLPGLYVAIENYHYKVIPLKFLITIVNSSQGIPFTPLVEVLFITILFETLYEASLRMPRYIGLGLSVVGALILGQTAVSAGLVSPPAIMIVALTGVILYTVPDQEAQLSMLRLIFTIIGGVLGLFGIVLCIVFIIIQLASIDSFGVPYIAPLAPLVKNDLQDTTNVVEIKKMKKRPQSIPNENKTRIGKI